MKKLFSILALTWVCAAAQAATETSWDFKTIIRGTDRGIGRLTLIEDGDKAEIRYQAIYLSACSKRPWDAKVERTETMTTIVAETKLSGCEKRRYQMKNDGTGTSESWIGDQWVINPDQVMTLRR